MHEAWVERDMESLASFMTPDMRRYFRDEAADEETPAYEHPFHKDILGLRVSLFSLKIQDGQEWAAVQYTVLMPGHDSVAAGLVEIWDFVRGGGGDTWRLARMSEPEDNNEA
jgi:predicted lipid-binding transport protein (Tim44 family)